jgi:hypothetical protein
MSLIKRPINNNWYYLFQIHGRKYFGSTGTPKKTLAVMKCPRNGVNPRQPPSSMRRRHAASRGALALARLVGLRLMKLGIYNRDRVYLADDLLPLTIHFPLPLVPLK